MNRKLVLALTLTLLIGTLNVAFNVQNAKASGTIYIRADGSVYPPDAPISTVDNVTYTLTGNITTDDGIVIERDNTIVDGAGYTFSGTGAFNSKGMSLSGRSNVTVKNTNIRKFYPNGIYIYGSSDNAVSGNNITANPGDGICFEGGSDNTVSGNNITNNGCGLRLEYFGPNHVRICSIFGNNITNNNEGIHFYRSFNNSISKNDVTDNSLYGIYFDSSSNNSISGNDITNNSYGIGLVSSSDNTVCHNNFINNTVQVSDYTPEQANFWDNGCEGNYWSNYTGTDANHDGIGDTPYIINANNTDQYPLMSIIPEFPSFLILPTFMLAALLAVVLYRKKKERS